MSAATMPHAALPAEVLPQWACARYGLLALPLAFVAMPLYVVLPAHYGATLGLPLGLLGAVLLATRLADAVLDPLLGRWADGWLRQGAQARAVMQGAAMALAVSFGLLFFPQVQGQAALAAWCALSLIATFAAFSTASVLHLAWGTRLGGSPSQRARLVAWREGLGLLGVLMANVVAVQAGLMWMSLLLCLMLALGVAGLMRGPQPAAGRAGGRADSALSQDLALPWRTPAFRRLIGLFLLNGVASAVPATLVLFFIQDSLQAAAWAPLFLGAYFVFAALSVPWWLRVMARRGLMPAWALGMALSVLAFVGVMALRAGDTWAYLLICMASGWALGADLTVPGTLLTGLVQRAGHAGLAEGTYAGWWQWATKLNLALAAGLALPALQALGYSPGVRGAEGLLALTLVYGALPCAFKLISLVLCWRWRTHPAFA